MTNLPPSVKDFHTVEEPEVYEGYLYRYTNLNDNRVYVGVHKGYVGDGYWHSSTDTEFNKIFSSSTSNLKLEILEYGDYADMTVSERKILKDNDAQNNPLFINKSNGSAKYFQPDVDAMKALADDILNRCYAVTMESVDDVYELPRLQVRFEEDADHRREIKERIEDAGGNTDKCSPIVIYERRQGGKDIVGDGNHTLGGAKDAKHCSEIPVIRIPEDVHSEYSNQELRGVSNLLNKKPDIIKKSMTVDDAVKYIVGTTTEGTPYDSKGNKDYLEACGSTKRQIGGILKKAKIELDTNNLFIANVVWIDYTSKTHKPTLTATVEAFRDDNTISLAYSSGMFKWDHLFNNVFASTDKKAGKREKTRTHIVLTIYHPTKDSEEKWITEYKPDIYEKLKFFLSPLGFTFKIHEMPTTLSNIL